MTEAQRDPIKVNESLADAYFKSGRYTPVFLLIAGVGVLAIFLLNQFGILGEPAPQLLVIGISTLLFGILEWMVIALLAGRNKGIAAYFIGTLLVAVYAVIMAITWQSFIYLSIFIVLIVPVTGLMSGMPKRLIPWLGLITLVSIGAVIFAERFIEVERLRFNSAAAIATLAFLSATSLLLITITIITQSRSFRSLRGLLLTSFIMIVTIPTIMATILSGVGTYANNQTQAFNTLKAISNLKEGQITFLLDEIKSDADKIQEDIRFKQNILPVLTTTSETDPDQTTSYRALARAFVLSIQRDKGKYAEIMVLDTKGTVVLSTDFAHTDLNYENQLFFRQGTVKFFTGFADIEDFGNQNFIVATPLYDTNGQIIRGVIVLRSDANAVKRIMETTPGYVDAETYLVDKAYNPVTATHTGTQKVRTKGTLDAILENIDGQATYTNYANEDVLGYYRWYEPMQMAIIAELPVQVVFRNSLASLAGSSLLALFVIGIAIAAVTIAARSITDPIKELAQITESYAAGKFNVRAHVDRKDEIGALAISYNSMAGELQDIIGKLEQRVADRTSELENQTLRVRVAAEIARDAASARDLGELLDSSAKLILERFHFYHTGIFLLDKNREFATLTATTTEAGKQMIANGYKLRVGEAGIVGRVASTGESRLSLDTESDLFYANNPLLPDTRSEMALPLKVGNLVIGVLDVQSDRPRAFTQDDVDILQVMADQLATAIERTRLLQEVEYNLQELEKAYGQYTREGWQKVTSSQLVNRGYRSDSIHIEPINKTPDISIEAETSSNPRTKNAVAIPIKLRGQTIGVISAKLKEGYSTRTVSTLKAATERLAAALESARLYEEARSRADREQAIAHVTTRISTATEFESILRTTVEEIGKSLDNSEVSIQIISDLDGQDSNS